MELNFDLVEVVPKLREESLKKLKESIKKLEGKQLYIGKTYVDAATGKKFDKRYTETWDMKGINNRKADHQKKPGLTTMTIICVITASDVPDKMKLEEYTLSLESELISSLKTDTGYRSTVINASADPGGKKKKYCSGFVIYAVYGALTYYNENTNKPKQPLPKLAINEKRPRKRSRFIGETDETWEDYLQDRQRPKLDKSCSRQTGTNNRCPAFPYVFSSLGRIPVTPKCHQMSRRMDNPKPSDKAIVMSSDHVDLSKYYETITPVPSPTHQREGCSSAASKRDTVLPASSKSLSVVFIGIEESPPGASKYEVDDHIKVSFVLRKSRIDVTGWTIKGTRRLGRYVKHKNRLLRAFFNSEDTVTAILSKGNFDKGIIARQYFETSQSSSTARAGRVSKTGMLTSVT